MTIPVGLEGLALLVQPGRLGAEHEPYCMVMLAIADRVGAITTERDVVTSDYSIHRSAEQALADALSWRADFENGQLDAKDYREALEG